MDGSAPETAAGPLVGQLVLNLGGAPSAPLFSSTLETKFRWSSAKVQLNELNYLNDYFKQHLVKCWARPTLLMSSSAFALSSPFGQNRGAV